MGFPLPTRAEHVWVCILTARCNMRCSYCIQKGLVLPDAPRRPWARYEELSGAAWVKAFNDLPVRPERPLILTGGEPTLHRGFAEIVAGLEGYRIDLTSNLRTDLDGLAAAVERRGKAIETSFHTYAPEHMEPEEYIARAERILAEGIIEKPIFSTVNLDLFPQFTTPETREKVTRLHRLALERGIPMARNEFRANHLGRPFMREERRPIECSSGWVNFAPDGEIYNCQYHLTEGRNSFGNLTDPAGIRPLPALGTFFPCADFGWCDPCHENSGTGMFREPATGEIFRRDPDASPMLYTRWLSPAQLQESGRHFVESGRFAEGETFLRAACEKGDDPGLHADLGVALWNLNRLEEALACFDRALEGGYDDPSCRENRRLLAAEMGLAPGNPATGPVGAPTSATESRSCTGTPPDPKPIPGATGMPAPAPRATTPSTSPTRVLVDIQGGWGLGDLLCADGLIDAIGEEHGPDTVDIRLRGKTGNLLHHPLVNGTAPDTWQPNRTVEVQLFTHMDKGAFARLEALPSLVEHMASYGGYRPERSRPRLHLTETDREAARALDLDHRPGNPVVLLCADHLDPLRHWPRERWQTVVDHLNARGARVLLAGLQPALQGGIDLGEGRLTLRQLAGVLERCDLFVGNNTGTFHYAQAAGTPCLTLFSLALPQRFIHDGALVVPLQADLACTNCRTLEHERGGLPGCPGTCMAAIDERSVINALEWLLAGHFDNLGPDRRDTPESLAFRADTWRRHAYTLEQFGHTARADRFYAEAHRAYDTLPPMDREAVTRV